MSIKNKISGDIELDSLIKEGRWSDAIRAGRRQVKWLYNNSNRTTMVVDEKLVWLIVQTLQNKIKDMENPINKIKNPASTYDQLFGDERPCKCGHLYRQHFDSAENMRHIGCKYCSCYDFKEDVPAIPVQI